MPPPAGTGPAIAGGAVGASFTVAFDTRGGDARQAFVPAVFLHDGAGAGHLVVGPRGADAALRVRLRAARWRLRAPWLVAPGALAGVREGDTTRLTRWSAVARGDTVRLTVATGGRVRTAAVRLTPTMAWALLLPYARPWGPERVPLTALWLAALLAPVGYWLRWWAAGSPWRGRLSLAAGAAAVAIGLAGVPRLLGAAPADASEWWSAALVLGLAYASAGRVITRTTSV